MKAPDVQFHLFRQVGPDSREITTANRRKDLAKHTLEDWLAAGTALEGRRHLAKVTHAHAMSILHPCPRRYCAAGATPVSISMTRGFSRSPKLLSDTTSVPSLEMAALGAAQ